MAKMISLKLTKKEAEEEYSYPSKLEMKSRKANARIGRLSEPTK